MKLTKGQKAKGISDKEKSLKETTEKRLIWLQKAVLTKNIPEDFTAFAQKEFCNLVDEEKGFIKISQNTYKKHLGKKYSEAKNLLKLLKNINSKEKSRPKKTREETIADKKRIINSQTLLIQSLADDLLALRTAYIDLYKKLNELPDKHNSLSTTIKRHRERYSLYLLKNGEHR